VSPVVVWLASTRSKGVTGRVFGIVGGRLNLHEGWTRGPLAEKKGRWDPAELDSVVADLIERGVPPERMM